MARKPLAINFSIEFLVKWPIYIMIVGILKDIFLRRKSRSVGISLIDHTLNVMTKTFSMTVIGDHPIVCDSCGSCNCIFLPRFLFLIYLSF